MIKCIILMYNYVFICLFQASNLRGINPENILEYFPEGYCEEDFDIVQHSLVLFNN